MRLALFDIAGTIVSGNPWRGILKYEGMSKIKIYSRYPAIVPPYWAKNAGIITDTRFRQVWVRQMAELCGGMSRDEADAMFRWIATEFCKDAYQEDVMEKVREHKASGDYVLLVSGMFTPFAQQFALSVGADAGVGTELGFDANGICTGKIIGNVCAGELKPEFAFRYLAAQGMDHTTMETFAYADSYSDVALLSYADHATATYPDEGLAEVVAEKGWAVIGQAQAHS
ncbi:MAG: HAD-IB family phosphatase [Chloroflexota bacterium]